MRVFLTLLAILCPPTLFAAVHCDEVLEELSAMRRAQQSVISSLAENHQSFADAVEDYAGAVRSSRPSNKVLAGLQRTGKAFRQRGQKGADQARALDRATAALIDDVRECINRK